MPGTRKIDRRRVGRDPVARPGRTCRATPAASEPWTVIDAREAAAMRDLASARGLLAPAAFWTDSPASLAACYNGIGPDRWSSALRGLVTRLLERYEVDALIHDWEYTFQPKTRRVFALANARFAVNAAINAFCRYSLRSRAAWIDAGLGAVLAGICQLWGWQGFREACPPRIFSKQFTQGEPSK